MYSQSFRSIDDGCQETDGSAKDRFAREADLSHQTEHFRF